MLCSTLESKKLFRVHDLLPSEVVERNSDMYTIIEPIPTRLSVQAELDRQARHYAIDKAFSSNHEVAADLLEDLSF